MPEWEPAGKDQLTVDAVKLTTVNSGGVVYAPQAWAGGRLLAVRGPEWWEVVENPAGILVKWLDGEKTTIELEADVEKNPQIYAGRPHEGEIVLLAQLEN